MMWMIPAGQTFRNFLGGLFDGLMGFLSTNLGKMVVLLTAPVVGFFLLIMAGIAKLESYMNSMISQDLSAMDGNVTLTLGTGLAMANSLVPIDLLFIYMGILAQVWVLGLAYRTVKSFVPTLS